VINLKNLKIRKSIKKKNFSKNTIKSLQYSTKKRKLDKLSISNYKTSLKKKNKSYKSFKH